MSNVRHIIKYENRKLYDSETTAYLTMEEVGDILARGEKIFVSRDVDDADVTFQVMARALYERLKRSREARPFDEHRLGDLFKLVEVEGG